MGMLTSLDWYIQPDPGEIMFYSYFPEMQQAPDGMYWGTSFSRMIPASEPSRGSGTAWSSSSKRTRRDYTTATSACGSTINSRLHQQDLRYSRKGR